MKKIFFTICILLMIPSVLNGQEIDEDLFKGYDVAFVIYDRSAREEIKVNPSFCSERLSPCSTFKIYNTLIVLELGLIQDPDAAWYEWDGVKRGIDAWNRDLTLREAFRVSAVPAYKILARKIGAEKMDKYVKKIHYGNMDISAGIDKFWLDPTEGRPLLISADEQVALLNELLDEQLPFSGKNVAILKDIMKVSETKKGILYGKTGSSMDSDGKWSLGWFVGFLEHAGTTYVFACNITGGENPSGLVARKIVENIFAARGLL